jgi:hypothetical protein
MDKDSAKVYITFSRLGTNASPCILKSNLDLPKGYLSYKPLGILLRWFRRFTPAPDVFESFSFEAVLRLQQMFF